MLKEFGSFFGKLMIFIMLALLVLSFIVWDIGGMIRGSSNTTAAKVNGEEISIPEVRRQTNNEMFRMQQMGLENTPENQVFVQNAVIDRIINQKLIDSEFKDIGIAISKEYIGNIIINDTRFFGISETGKSEFNKDQFSNFLRQSGMSEKEYVKLLKREMLVSMMVGSASSIVPLQADYAKQLNLYDNERRQLGMLIIPTDINVNIPSPSQADLIHYFQENESKFAAPELRDFTYLTFGLEAAKSLASVADDEVKSEYESRIEEFTSPEKRKLMQMVFLDKNAAKAAYSELKEGKEFTKVAATHTGVNDPSTLDYGNATKDDLGESGLFEMEDVDKLFSLKDGDVSNPIKSELGWHILKVTGREAEKILTLSEASEQVKSDLLEQKQMDVLYNLSNDVEDMLAGGATLEEIAKQLNLEIKKVKAVDTSGKRLSGSVVENLNKEINLSEIAFNTKLNSDSGVSANADETLFSVVRVDNITESRIRALDEVKATVIEAWKKESKKQKIAEKARKISKDLRKNNSDAKKFKDIASDSKIKYQQSDWFTRKEPNAEIPSSLRHEIFELKKNEISKAHRHSDGSYIIARIKNIETAGKNELDKTKKELGSTWQNDWLSAYLNYLRNKHEVEYIPF